MVASPPLAWKSYAGLVHARHILYSYTSTALLYIHVSHYSNTHTGFMYVYELFIRINVREVKLISPEIPSTKTTFCAWIQLIWINSVGEQAFRGAALSLVSVMVHMDELSLGGLNSLDWMDVTGRVMVGIYLRHGSSQPEIKESAREWHAKWRSEPFQQTY